MTKPNKDLNEAGTNMQIGVYGNYIIIQLPIDEDAVAIAKPSKSGKTRVVSSTHGTMAVPGRADLRLNLNLFKKR